MMCDYGTERHIMEVPNVIIVDPGRCRSGQAITESNELLTSTNANESMRMKEFDRVDSEDDILGEYGECTTKTQWLRSRTFLEKCMFVVLIITLIIIVILSCIISSHKQVKEEKSTCETKDCIETASSILNSLDVTANPCEDFYQYACGGWEKDTPIPPAYPVWDRFQELSYKNLHHLRDLLVNLKLNYSSGVKAKTFYESCMRESRQNRNTTVQKFSELIKNISKSSTFDVTLENIHLLNVWPIFSISIGPDERQTDNNIIKIDYGDTHFPFGEATLSVTLDYGNRSDNTNATESSANIKATKSALGFEYLKWTEKEVEARYLKESTRLLNLIWNMTENEAKSWALQLLNLEKDISKSRNSDLYAYNRSSVYNVMPIHYLQSKCPLLDWMLYMDVILEKSNKKVSLNEEVVVLHEDGLFRICGIIHNYLKAKKTEVVNMFLTLHLVRSLMPFFDAKTFDYNVHYNQEIEEEREQWRRCVFYTNQGFGFVTGAMYVNGTSKTNSVIKIKALVRDVKDAFKDYLLQKHWMDMTTRKHAEEKIDEMLAKISYPDDILKSHFLDDLYQDFHVGEDWFYNIEEMNRFKARTMFDSLGNPVDRKSWIRPPITVESDYSPVRNDVMFPIAMFHLPFYTEDGPQALNFGAMGAIVGHEITHAFDITGRQYDGKGKLKQWWDPQAIQDFRKTTGCMKEQYDKYNLDGLPINGYRTLEENIADNGGLRAAYIAYQLWERKHGNSLSLPGVHFSNKQLFYISYAQMFCSKWKQSGLKSHIIEDRHSPGPIRVIGAISNSNAFADLFSCPFISKYNPSTKCEVW